MISMHDNMICMKRVGPKWLLNGIFFEKKKRFHFSTGTIFLKIILFKKKTVPLKKEASFAETAPNDNPAHSFWKHSHKL